VHPLCCKKKRKKEKKKRKESMQGALCLLCFKKKEEKTKRRRNKISLNAGVWCPFVPKKTEKKGSLIGFQNLKKKTKINKEIQTASSLRKVHTDAPNAA
jgi:hypothetical protein